MQRSLVSRIASFAKTWIATDWQQAQPRPKLEVGMGQDGGLVTTQQGKR